MVTENPARTPSRNWGQAGNSFYSKTNYVRTLDGTKFESH